MRHVTTRFAGLVIFIAGLWGALIPFIGPYFHFVLGPDQHWKWTTGRLWLNVLPGAVAALGGLILMGGGPRVSGRFGAFIALAAGVWFIVGPDVSLLWNHGVSEAGTPVGRHTFKKFLELLTFHSGLGALITAFAAYSLPGVTVYAAEPATAEREPVRRGRAGRDVALAGGGAAAGAAAEDHHERRVAEREEAAGAGTGTAAGAGAGTAAGAGAGTSAGAGTAAAAPATERQEVATHAQRAPAQGAGTGASDEGTAVHQPTATQAGTRRRGGLAGFFSRR
jgi:hypothetical protein